MTKFDVTFAWERSQTFTVEAESPQEARVKAEAIWDGQDAPLSSLNYVVTDDAEDHFDSMQVASVWDLTNGRERLDEVE